MEASEGEAARYEANAMREVAGLFVGFFFEWSDPRAT